jgi:hypothetical protein
MNLQRSVPYQATCGLMSSDIHGSGTQVGKYKKHGVVHGYDVITIYVYVFMCVFIYNI